MISGFFGAAYVIWLYYAWLPQYLEIQWHLSIVKTGWVAAVPFVCGVAGSLMGSGICDLLLRRGLLDRQPQDTAACVRCLAPSFVRCWPHALRARRSPWVTSPLRVAVPAQLRLLHRLGDGGRGGGREQHRVAELHPEFWRLPWRAHWRPSSPDSSCRRRARFGRHCWSAPSSLSWAASPILSLWASRSRPRAAPINFPPVKIFGGLS